MKYEIYTDGSSYNNGFCISKDLPQVSAGAFILLDENKNIIEKKHYGYKDQTISYAELKTVIHALSYIINGNFKKNDSFIIYSDSQFVIKGINEWLPNWIKRGYRNSSGEEVGQKELWQLFVKLRADATKIGLNIKYEKVKGHSDNEFNNIVDKMAGSAMNILKEKMIPEEMI